VASEDPDRKSIVGSRINIPEMYSLCSLTASIPAQNISRGDKKVYKLREDDLGAIYAVIVVRFGRRATDVCSR
jgi:hypothetical protein